MIKDQKGAAVVELAIVLPLVLLFLFGIIEFGLLMYNKAMITNAAREGARAGIIYTDPDPRLDQGAVKTVVDNYLQTFLVNFSSNKKASTSIQQIDNDGNGDNDDSGDSLIVTVVFDYDFLAFPNLAELVYGSFTRTLTITAVATMRYE